MHGKKIRIHLVDGSPTGTLTAEIMNWTGHALVFPRAKLADVAKRQEVRRTGVYCLVGHSAENPSRESVYIGAERGVLFEEGVGDVLEEDQAEDDVLVLGGVHVAAELLGGLPEAVLEAKG